MISKKRRSKVKLVRHTHTHHMFLLINLLVAFHDSLVFLKRRAYLGAGMEAKVIGSILFFTCPSFVIQLVILINDPLRSRVMEIHSHVKRINSNYIMPF